MARLKRIGELIEDGERSRTGDRRILQAAENLAMHIFFPDVISDYRYYIQRRPTIKPEIPGLPRDVIRLGEYESMLLGKLLRPTNPVICVEGAIGAGKTTTINYLTQHILGRMDCGMCRVQDSNSSCKRLIAHIDFKVFAAGSKDRDSQIQKLLEALCDELRAQSTFVINSKEECFAFWKRIVDQYESRVDPEVRHVVRHLLAQAPWLSEEVAEHSDAELNRRKDLLSTLIAQDTEWYLRYLVLLWRYLLQTRYTDQRECALVVLDNLDTLEPHLQRRLIDFVLRNASQQGPTFIVLMRPETRKRQGLADTLADVLNHQGPAPVDVVMDRLERFCKDPDSYLTPELGLTHDQSQLVTQFLLRIHERILSDQDNVFSDFLQRAAGQSVRLALMLAQGLLLVRVVDMKNPDLSPHFLVRASITRGDQQFRAVPRSPIDNPFHIPGVGEGRFLIKLRILRYLSDRGKQGSLSGIRSAFTLFGYREESVKRAVNQMLRNECQLIRSDGYDIYRRDWGDEQETLYLTTIGEGYLEHLIYSADFVQEVMLDAYVDPSDWPISYRDRLTEKLHLLYLFLRTLHKVDIEEVDSFVKRLGPIRYSDLFGGSLVTLELIQQIYHSVGRILCNVAEKYPRHRQSYVELLDQFTSLVRMGEKANEDLLGVTPHAVDTISLDDC